LGKNDQESLKYGSESQTEFQARGRDLRTDVVEAMRPPQGARALGKL
jgi:hypothetical protein